MSDSMGIELESRARNTASSGSASKHAPYTDSPHESELQYRPEAVNARKNAPPNSRDAVEMNRMGKIPVLKRNFGFMSIFGFASTVLVTWEGALVTYMQGFQNGGPGGVIFGFLIVWLGTLSTFAVIGELASMAPLSGGQYYWVSMLAPKSCSRLLSYTTGWMTFAGWQALTASSSYLIGTLIQALIINTDRHYVPKPWQGMLLYWGVIFVGVFVNTIASRALARFEGIVLVLHVFGFLAVLIPLLYLGPRNDVSIYTTFLNEGGWSTQSLSFCVGLPGSIFTLLGADSSVHMAEEINNASLVIPRALMTTIFVNGLLGFGMIFAFTTCLGDIDAVLAAQDTVLYPFIEVFNQATGSIAGSTFMASIVVAMGVFSCVGILAAASRLIWSFSRERAIPFHNVLVRLDPRTSVPNYSIGATSLISVILSFIALGSSIAFVDLVSLTVSAMYSSYLICCVLLLWRRCRGDIKPEKKTTSDPGGSTFVWGRWRIPGILGIANNILAVTYLVVLCFFSFWPPTSEVDSMSLNWSVVLFVVVLGFSMFWYLIQARKTYVGPVIETRYDVD